MNEFRFDIKKIKKFLNLVVAMGVWLEFFQNKPKYQIHLF